MDECEWSHKNVSKHSTVWLWPLYEPVFNNDHDLINSKVWSLQWCESTFKPLQLKRVFIRHCCCFVSFTVKPQKHNTVWIVPLCPLPEKCPLECTVNPVGVGKAQKQQQLMGSGGLLSDEILLWVFRGEGLGIRLIVEGKLRTVLPFDPLPLLVLEGVFPSVQESGSYGQAGHGHKDDHSYDTWNTDRRSAHLNRKQLRPCHHFL